MNDIVILKKSQIEWLPTYGDFQQVQECFEVMPGEIRIGYTDILTGEYLEAGIKRAEGTQELENKYLRAMNEQQIAEMVEARYEPLKEDFANIYETHGMHTFEFYWENFKEKKVESIMQLKANLKF